MKQVDTSRKRNVVAGSYVSERVKVVKEIGMNKLRQCIGLQAMETD